MMPRRELHRTHSDMVPASPEKELIHVDSDQIREKAIKAGSLDLHSTFTYRSPLKKHDNLPEPSGPPRTVYISGDDHSDNDDDESDEREPASSESSEENHVQQQQQPPRRRSSRQPRMARSGSSRSLHSVDSVRLKKTQVHKSSQPMTLMELLRRGSAEKGRQSKSILKRSTSNASTTNNQQTTSGKKSTTSLSSHLGDGDALSKKSVTFATNSFNDRVWSMVKSIDVLSRDGEDGNQATLDGTPKNDLWYTESEIQDIRAGLWEIIEKCSPEYSNELQDAYESTGLDPIFVFQPGKAQEEDEEYGTVPESFKLSSEAVCKYSDARGLENVINPVLDEFKMAHRMSVIQTQQLLKRTKRAPVRRRSGGSKQVSKAAFQYNDADWDTIRAQSLERSRPCRYASLRLGQIDQQQAAKPSPSKRNTSVKNGKVPRQRVSKQKDRSFLSI